MNRLFLRTRNRLSVLRAPLYSDAFLGLDSTRNNRPKNNRGKRLTRDADNSLKSAPGAMSWATWRDGPAELAKPSWSRLSSGGSAAVVGVAGFEASVGG